MARAFWINVVIIIDGNIPALAACSKKNEDGAIPEDEFGSVIKILPSFR
jgi:hypothetical protein